MFSKLSVDKYNLKRDGIYKIPKFSSLFTYYVNSFIEDSQWMNKALDKWYDYSLLPKEHYDKRIRNATWLNASVFFPFCTNKARFEVLAKFVANLNIFDDHEETPVGQFVKDRNTSLPVIKKFFEIVEIFESKYINDIQFEKSINWNEHMLCLRLGYESVEQILIVSNKQQAKRILVAWRQFFEGKILENEIVDKQEMDFDILKSARLKSSAVKNIFAFNEYSENIFVPEKDWNDDRVQGLMNIGNLIISFTNDVYSFEKEFVEQNNNMKKLIWNIVGFNCLKRDCSVEMAMTISINTIKEYEAQYKDIVIELMNDQSLDRNTKIFLRAMTAQIGGNYKYSIASDRYNKIHI